MLTVLDLFAGIGGATLGHQLANRVEKDLDIQTTQFVEIDPDAQRVLKANFPNIPIHSDIRDYHPKRGEFDVIWSSFPCTGTSNAGTRTGLDHPESALWREGMRCIIEGRPRFCIIEQPTGVIKRGLRSILGFLRMAGYNFEIEIISAAELGAAHRRERLFIIAYPHGQRWQERTGKDDSTGWQHQIREQIERVKSVTEWATVKRGSSSGSYGFSPVLVRDSKERPFNQFTTPTNTQGRLKARILAGRAVTPAQAAVCWLRVNYLSGLSKCED